MTRMYPPPHMTRAYNKQADEDKSCLATALQADFCYFKSALLFFEAYYLKKDAGSVLQTAGVSCVLPMCCQCVAHVLLMCC